MQSTLFALVDAKESGNWITLQEKAMSVYVIYHDMTNRWKQDKL